MKSKIAIITAVVLILLCGLAGGFYYLENYDAIYYTQIDNAKAEKLSADSDMKYEYTLDCYTEDGKQKELTFKTQKQLREDAYILLEVRSLGVHKWEEVQFDDLPQNVQAKINKA